jgi:hypothetical protein
MGALVALTVGASLRFMAVQQVNVSQQTVSQVASALDKQWQAVIDKAAIEPVSTQAMLLAGSDTRVARVIHVKLRLQQEFPMSYTEILSAPAPSAPPVAGVLPALPNYLNALSTAGITTGSSPPTPAENSACLLLALTLSGTSGLVINTDDFGPQAIRDTNADGLQEIVDAYGTPIVYFRWPWANHDMTGDPGYFPASTTVVYGPGLNPATVEPYKSSFKDPQDKEGQLLKASWNPVTGGPSASVTSFEGICHQVHDATAATYTPASYYMVPAVASAGANGAFGLDLIPINGMALLTTNDANDNIYSYHLRLGGAAK